jgi:hypothetical protein
LLLASGTATFSRQCAMNSVAVHADAALAARSSRHLKRTAVPVPLPCAVGREPEPLLLPRCRRAHLHGAAAHSGRPAALYQRQGHPAAGGGHRGGGGQGGQACWLSCDGCAAHAVRRQPHRPMPGAALSPPMCAVCVSAACGLRCVCAACALLRVRCMPPPPPSPSPALHTTSPAGHRRRRRARTELPAPRSPQHHLPVCPMCPGASVLNVPRCQ